MTGQREELLGTVALITGGRFLVWRVAPATVDTVIGWDISEHQVGKVEPEPARA